MRYYEDIVVGETSSFGSYEVTREEVIDFASKYDPQPFHLSDEAAAQTYFGRLSASGWHTGAMAMRMLVDNMTANPTASLGSPGLDGLKWVKPVYPGDTLRCKATTLEKRRSKTNPAMGLMKAETRVFNQDDILVMTMVSNALITVRDPNTPPD